MHQWIRKHICFGCEQLHRESAIAAHFEDAAIQSKFGRKQILSYSRKGMRDKINNSVPATKVDWIRGRSNGI